MTVGEGAEGVVKERAKSCRMPLDDDLNLTDKQALFVLAYAQTVHGRKSAVIAGYSKDTAQAIATENLSKPAIVEAIRREMQRRAKELRMEADWVVLQWHDCYVQARELFDMASALKALDMIAKHLGIYERDNRQKSGTDAEAIRQRLRERGFDLERLQAPLVPPPSEN